MKDDLVSIIVPMYNAWPYVEKCLRSLQEQSYKNIEVIIVDDGSTDYGSEYSDRIASEDRRFRVIHKNNGGVSRARNIALKKISGQYVMFCDADDYVDETWVEKMVIMLKNNDYVLGICNYNTMQNNEVAYSVNYQSDRIYNIDETYRDILRIGGCQGFSCNKIFRREFLDNVIFDEELSYGEDLNFVTDYLSKCPRNARIILIKDALYYYVQHRGSASSKECSLKKRHEQFTAENKCYTKFYEKILKLTNDNRVLGLAIKHLVNTKVEMMTIASALKDYESLSTYKKERAYVLNNIISYVKFEDYSISHMLRIVLFSFFPVLGKFWYRND